ncbi:programmed cell death 6-interacting protein-like [Saccoglossus kowalevskii]
MHSQIASVQSLESDEGLKKAARHFQLSAGIYSYLRDHVYTLTPTIRTPDIEPDVLSTLSAIMLAQAQEVFFKKAVMDKMKSVVIAKIANQAHDLYADALKSCNETIPKDWYSILAGKTPYFQGEAEYHQSLVCKAAKNFGEEISRLRHASELIEAAHNRGGLSVSFKDTAAKIKRNYDESKKDNDFIYHERVPDVGSLAAIGKAPIAKAIPPSTPMGAQFTDLFEKLVPLSVHQSVTSFENRKAEIVNREIGKLRSKTEFLNGVLSTFNLPAAIEDISGNNVPPSLLEKSRNMQQQGGLHALDQMISELPELLQRNKEILDESIRLLDKEQSSDDQMRGQFKERWTRVPSQQLTEPLRAEAAKYKGILDNAIQADHIVKEKYNAHKDGFILMNKSESDLAKGIPTAGPTATPQGSSAVKELRQLLDQVNSMKKERDVLEQQIKETTLDMRPRFLEALAADGAIDEEAISTQQLEQTYGVLSQQANESSERQDALLANIERTNMQFCKEKQSNAGAQKREEMLRKLAAAYDAFMELLANLKEGTKFYNDLTPLLLRFQSKATDFVFARKTEKEELMKDLQQNIVNQPTGPTPAAPSHHGGQGASRQPPPRPPPPSVQQPQYQQQQQQPQQPYAPAYSQYTPPPMPTGYNPYAPMNYPAQPQYPYPQGQPPQQQYGQQQQYPYPQQQPPYQYGNPPYPRQ